MSPPSQSPESELRSLLLSPAFSHGFYITPAAGRRWHGHTGSDPGVSARVGFAAGTGSSVVVLCNAESIAFRIFHLLLQCLGAEGAELDQRLDLQNDERTS